MNITISYHSMGLVSIRRGTGHSRPYTPTMSSMKRLRDIVSKYGMHVSNTSRLVQYKYCGLSSMTPEQRKIYTAYKKWLHDIDMGKLTPPFDNKWKFYDCGVNNTFKYACELLGIPSFMLDN